MDPEEPRSEELRPSSSEAVPEGDPKNTREPTSGPTTHPVRRPSAKRAQKGPLDPVHSKNRGPRSDSPALTDSEEFGSEELGPKELARASEATVSLLSRHRAETLRLERSHRATSATSFERLTTPSRRLRRAAVRISQSSLGPRPESPSNTPPRRPSPDQIPKDLHQLEPTKWGSLEALYSF